MKHHRHLALLAAGTLTVSVLAACADDYPDVNGDTPPAFDADGFRIIEVEMTEMAFAPASIDVKAGETYRLRFDNAGVVVHEAVIGDLAFQEGHAAEMAAGSAHGDTTADSAHEDTTTDSSHADMTTDSAHEDMTTDSADEGDAAHEANPDEPEPLIVAVGETGDLVYTAEAAGTLVIGCHQPGHWEAGMKANLNIN